MIKNKIFLRFHSEQKFEEFLFDGENISYKEVLKDYLAKKKKLVIPTEKEKMVHPDKADKIQLVNFDTRDEITDDIGGGMIEANTYIIVKRVPFKDYRPVEVMYNKINNNLTKIKTNRKLGLVKPGQTITELID